MSVIIMLITYFLVRYAFSEALHPCSAARNNQYSPSSNSGEYRLFWAVERGWRASKMHTTLEKHVIV